nr:hypothetical protein CFP56_66406 [Quercus suber]
MTQSLNPTLAQNGLGSNKSNEACFSGPSIYELGESSSLTNPTLLAHLETSTLAPLEQPNSLLPTVAELEQQILLPMPISCNCSDKISSNKLTMAKIGVGINSDGLVVKLMEYNSSCLDGKSSDSPAVDRLEVGTSSDGPVEEPMEINCLSIAGFNSVGPAAAQMVLNGSSSDGFSSDDSTMVLGKTDMANP